MILPTSVTPASAQRNPFFEMSANVTGYSPHTPDIGRRSYAIAMDPGTAYVYGECVPALWMRAYVRWHEERGEHEAARTLETDWLKAHGPQVHS